MKEVHTYIVLVDSRRHTAGGDLLRLRRTAGRYRVGARSMDEAIRLVRSKVGFGKISIYYKDDKLNLQLGEVYKELPGGNLERPIHATKA